MLMPGITVNTGLDDFCPGQINAASPPGGRAMAAVRQVINTNAVP